ncbi:MAG TPA: outer membrane protein assembly factor BamD [Pyrinomonadaceae bacterium]|nr:outer membrane protein assembly factor BamD [Pyrinomonadaceae bacterium]
MKNILMIGLLALAVLCVAPSASAQGTAKTGPDASTVRDPEIEKDSLHNLNVARQYFKLKKAYVAALARCEEIIAGNPTFAQMDEVLYIAGASSLRLAQKLGKQASKMPPDKLRDDAREYLSRLTKDFPESEFREQAEKELRTLKP